MSDWKTLNPDYYTDPGGRGTFGLLYNPKTGDYQIKQKSVLGTFDAPGLAILYQNGVWYSDALRIPDLFTYAPGDVLQANPIPTNTALSLNLRAKSDVNTAFGGVSSGNKLNSSAQGQNRTTPATTSNAAPGANPGVAGAVPGLAAPQGEGNIGALFSPGLPNPGQFPTTPNPAATGPSSVLKYPKDLLETRQDTLHITQIEYQSPNQDIFNTGDIQKILNTGVQRSSVLGKKKPLGKVILPIPNNPQDGNTVDWGQDNMDAFATAATAALVQKPGEATAGILGAELAKGLANFKGASGLANVLGNSPQAIFRLYLASQSNMNASVKAAFQSFLLKRLGFEIPPENILSRGFGVVPNSNLQLLFNNVTLRSFNFSYMMSPRSKEEANDVNKILRFFKQGMAAKKQTLQAGGASLFLGTPNVFKLEYKSGNKSIAGMNKFKICALTGFTVNYAPSGQWAAYEEGQPASVLMTMGFREIEPVYESDYRENTGDLSFDLPSVTSKDIGY